LRMLATASMMRAAVMSLLPGHAVYRKSEDTEGPSTKNGRRENARSEGVEIGSQFIYFSVF
jgi:hypothetical protein